MTTPSLARTSSPSWADTLHDYTRQWLRALADIDAALTLAATRLQCRVAIVSEADLLTRMEDLQSIWVSGDDQDHLPEGTVLALGHLFEREELVERELLVSRRALLSRDPQTLAQLAASIAHISSALRLESALNQFWVAVRDDNPAPRLVRYNASGMASW